MRLLYTSLFILLLCTCGRAQKMISGTVLDDSGQPLIAVSIQIVGTTSRTITDIDGYFSLVVPEPFHQATLQLSYTGFKTLKYKLKRGETTLNLMLEADVEMLDEVVVVGYATHRKQSVSSSVQSISSESFSRNKSQNRKQKPRRKKVPVASPVYKHVVPNAFVPTSTQPISTLSTDVDRAAYANVRSYLNRGQLPPAAAVRIEEMINYFPYARPAFAPEDPVHLNAEIITCPWRKEARLLRVTAEAPAENLAGDVPSNLVFLIDVSGSMSSANKLPLVKESLRMLSRQLTANDRVSIVVYAGAAGRVLAPTAGNDTTAIFMALDNLNSGGSTAGGAGIELAYKTALESFLPEGNNRVVLATDGDFNVGISSEFELVKLIEKKRASGVYLTVLGYGSNNYQDEKMQELADRGNGNHAYIDSPVEARKVLIEEFGGTMVTVAKDVKLQLVFDPKYIESYRLIGYENRLLNTEDFDDDTKDAAEMGEGHQVTVLYEIVPTKDYALGHYVGTLKMRYKPAKGGRSRKLQFPIAGDRLPDELATTDIKWAAAVAEFGMLLRGSEHKGKADWASVYELAEANRGADPGGYRKEMLSLIVKARDLTARR